MLSYPQENLTVFLMLTIFSNITIESVSKSFSQKNAKYHESICMSSRGIKSTTCGSNFSSLLKTIQVLVIDPLSIVEQLKEQKSLSVFLLLTYTHDMSKRHEQGTRNWNDRHKVKYILCSLVLFLWQLLLKEISMPT